MKLYDEGEEKFYRMFYSNLRGMILIKLNEFGDLIFQESNPAAEQIFSFDCNQFIGERIQDVFPSLLNTEILNNLGKIAKHGGSWHSDQISYEDERVQGIFEIYAYYISEKTIITSFIDITERIMEKKN